MAFVVPTDRSSRVPLTHPRAYTAQDPYSELAMNDRAADPSPHSMANV